FPLTSRRSRALGGADAWSRGALLAWPHDRDGALPAIRPGLDLEGDQLVDHGASAARREGRDVDEQFAFALGRRRDEAKAAVIVPLVEGAVRTHAGGV